MRAPIIRLHPFLRSRANPQIAAQTNVSFVPRLVKPLHGNYYTLAERTFAIPIAHFVANQLSASLASSNILLLPFPPSPGSCASHLDVYNQVMRVQQTLVPGNNKQTSQLPNLYVPHRRLVCYCRLYEVYDVNRKERSGQHQREIFLFNDLLLVTKIYKKVVTNGEATCLYSYRGSYPLAGLSVILFEAPHHTFGIRLQRRMDEKVIITFNARNEHDRTRFVDDLKESIEEMNQMESIRIGQRSGNSSSGISFDCDAGQGPASGVDHGLGVPGMNTMMTKSNSLLDLATTSSSASSGKIVANGAASCATCTDNNGTSGCALISLISLIDSSR